jgi:hypothetical protein
MYTTGNGEFPINYYPSIDSKRWKIKVHDMLTTQASGDGTYSRIDPDSSGVHYANATVDSFYRPILIPTTLFPKFMTQVNEQFNKSGPAKGKVFCDDSIHQGNCWVQGLTCLQASDSFRDYYIELTDSKGYNVSKDSYLLDDKDKDENICSILIQRNDVPG